MIKNIYWFSCKATVIFQRNFLGQTAASKCESFPTFLGLTAGCAGVLDQTKPPS